MKEKCYFDLGSLNLKGRGSSTSLEILESFWDKGQNMNLFSSYQKKSIFFLTVFFVQTFKQPLNPRLIFYFFESFTILL